MQKMSKGNSRYSLTTLGILCQILPVTDVIILIIEDDVILSITEDDVSKF